MKKIIATAVLLIIFTGCGKNDTELINKDYTIAEKTDSESDIINENPDTKTEESKDNDAQEKDIPKNEISESGDRFAYKIQDGIMDFDSVNGPYYILDIINMTVLDCTCKNAKIVDYSFDGDILTITLYSEEHPVNETYVIDTSIKSKGTLPVS